MWAGSFTKSTGVVKRVQLSEYEIRNSQATTRTEFQRTEMFSGTPRWIGTRWGFRTGLSAPASAFRREMDGRGR